ncbi:hypothetical protein Adeh_0565 [Anaeromyxobacter dehalogenans 2CP-C]|uniref:Uncharacterized protein n=2 Tax=Anaeromyxobacter dehalogenans TaxID=161493 RepID=Q2INF8_ANADE|nr:hypothetical protein Adeh_0565 [Anaeromyxobacter dehalogenans 2CP-C]
MWTSEAPARPTTRLSVGRVGYRSMPPKNGYSPLLSGRTDNLAAHLSALKEEPPSQIRFVLRKLPPKLLRALTANFLPRTLGDLGKAPVGRSQETLQAELNWAAAIVSRYAAQLASYLKFSDSVERLFLLGRTDAAFGELRTAEAQLGVSLWSVRMSLLLAEHIGGLEANRAALTVLREASGLGTLNLLATYYSQRAERSVSLASYDTAVAQIFRQIPAENLDPWAAAYVRFHLSFHSEPHFQRQAFVLKREGAFSVIDRYETFVRTLQLLASGADGLDASIAVRPYAQLVSAIPDVRIRCLLAWTQPHNANVITDLTDSLVSLSDAYTRGDYAQVLEAAPPLLEAHPNALEFYELYALSHLHLGVPLINSLPATSPAAQALNNVYDVLQKDERTSEALDSLGKLAATLAFSRFASQLRAFRDSHSTHRQPFAGPVFFQLNTIAPSGRFATIFRRAADALAFLDALRRSDAESPSIALFRAGAEGRDPPPDVDPARRDRYRAHDLLRRQRTAEAANEFRRMLSEQQPVPVREECTRALAAACMSLQRWTECAELLARAFVEQPNLLATIEIAPVADAYPGIDPEGQASIAWPIICHIRYTQAPGPGTARGVVAALDNYLVAHNVEKPTELLGRAAGAPSPEFVYFLRNVCVPELMDSLVGFDSVADLQRERIALCQILREHFDKVHADTYADEIKRITQTLEVSKAIQHIDESKVNIDTNGIARSLDKSFRERFERFVSFSKLNEHLRKALALKGIVPESEDMIILSDERLEQFGALFGDIKSRFLSSNEYGLDAYLSMRIRHGTLAGQLRSQFELEHLITRKTAEGEYEPNTEWLERSFATTGHAATAEADKRLRAFSSDIDDLIEHFKSKCVQIRGPQNGNEGLFDFEYTNEDLRRLYVRFATVSEYDSFVHGVFAELWSRTERNLQKVVEHIRTRLEREFVSSLDRLASDLAVLNPELPHLPLGAAVARSKTNIHYELERVAGWFRKASDAGFPDFSLSLLAQTAVAIVQNCYPTHRLQPQVAIGDECTLRGTLFAAFNDLMFYLLENVVRHSRCTPATAVMRLARENERVRIHVENPLGPSVNVASVRERISYVASLRTSVPSGAVRSEGGTGFKKIHKALRVDMGLEEDFEFAVSVSDDGVFAVDISLPLQGLAP